jgi:hypothetical protein
MGASWATPQPSFIAVVRTGRDDVLQILRRGLPDGDVEVIWDRRRSPSRLVSGVARFDRRGAAPDIWTTRGFLLARRAPDERGAEPLSVDRLIHTARDVSESFREAIDWIRRAVERAEREPPPDRL